MSNVTKTPDQVFASGKKVKKPEVRGLLNEMRQDDLDGVTGAAAATAAAAAAAADRGLAYGYAIEAQTARDDAQSAASATGPLVGKGFYATRAEATTDLSNIPNGWIEINVDESNDSRRTRARISSHAFGANASDLYIFPPAKVDPKPLPPFGAAPLSGALISGYGGTGPQWPCAMRLADGRPAVLTIAGAVNAVVLTRYLDNNKLTQITPNVMVWVDDGSYPYSTGAFHGVFEAYGCVTTTGAVVVGWGLENGDLGQYPYVYFARSTRNGDAGSWTYSRVSISSISGTGVHFHPGGKPIDLGDGRIVFPFIRWDATNTGTTSAPVWSFTYGGLYLMVSTDDGKSWSLSNKITIAEASGSTYPGLEFGLAPLGSGRFVVIARGDMTGDGFLMWTSTTDMASWSYCGKVTFGDYPASGGWSTQPWLEVYEDGNGRTWVACYYYNRDTVTPMRVDGVGIDLINRGTGGWLNRSLQALASASTLHDQAGQLTALHDRRTPKSVCWYYDGNAAAQTVRSVASFRDYIYSWGEADIAYGSGALHLGSYVGDGTTRLDVAGQVSIRWGGSTQASFSPTADGFVFLGRDAVFTATANIDARNGGSLRAIGRAVASLPSAGASGRRATVTDSTMPYAAANIGTTVTGGGSNVVPVFDNGSAWVIG